MFVTIRRDRRGSRPERGQVLVLFALFLVVLMGATAVAVDYGSWLKVRRDYQNAVDPAALAGAALLTRPDSGPKRDAARLAAWEDLDRSLGLNLNNGELNVWPKSSTGLAGQVAGPYRIWVSTPPIQAGAAYGGTYTTSDSRTMFVRIERENPSYFGRVLGVGDQLISAWATAGVIPERYGVITLRQPGQAPGNIAANITLNGTGTNLEVVDGDVGSNWNMRLNSGSQLWLRGVGNNDADALLQEWISCGQSCWSQGQISSGPNGTPPWAPQVPKELPGLIPDPNYTLPTVLAGIPGFPIPSVPIGDPSDPLCCAKSSPGNVDIGGGSDDPPGGSEVVGGVLTCKPDSPRIGPGYYTSITVRSGNCLILDPTMRHSSVVETVPDVATPVAQDQLPGFFYLNGSINVDQGAIIVGDGITLVIRPGSGNQMLVSAGGVVDLNRGQTPGISAQKLGAWMRNGSSTYVWDATSAKWVYNTSLESDSRNVGVAIYVAKRSQYSTVAADDNTNVIKINAGAGLAWDGYTYAPHDNLALAGQPGHDAIGQFVSWTFTFSGGTTMKQVYVGPGDVIPYLLEPRLGQ